MAATRAAASAHDEIHTVEHGTWDAALRAMLVNVHSEGAVERVYVTSSLGRRLACREYTLDLDGVAPEAFEIEPCRTVSGVTSIRLVHRELLFDSRGAVPLPLPADLHVHVHSDALFSRPPPPVRCELTLHPEVDDLAHGTRIRATPTSFTLRDESPQPRFLIEPIVDGWRVRNADNSREWRSLAGYGNTERFAYTLVDNVTAQTVLRAVTNIGCDPRSSRHPSRVRSSTLWSMVASLMISGAVVGFGGYIGLRAGAGDAGIEGVLLAAGIVRFALGAGLMFVTDHVHASEDAEFEPWLNLGSQPDASLFPRF